MHAYAVQEIDVPACSPMPWRTRIDWSPELQVFRRRLGAVAINRYPGARR